MNTSTSDYVSQVRDGSVTPFDALNQLQDEIESITLSLARIGAVSNVLNERSREHGHADDPSIAEMGKQVVTMLSKTHDLSNRLQGILEEEDAQEWRNHVIGDEPVPYRVTAGGRRRMVSVGVPDFLGSHLIGS